MREYETLLNLQKVLARGSGEYSTAQIKYVLRFSMRNGVLFYENRPVTQFTIYEFNKLHRLAHRAWRKDAE